ncbi:hypothetical protein [Ktedonobacter sp. SOSP1-85]|uniref:hypothetical protein n=1 Tax=Ktedonobacter sp. SOSP1-85 TaxID=2778367 RepID=UPI0019150232|nr:hypothetical protein [Ktedonobacter sp. SOSP1-85]
MRFRIRREWFARWSTALGKLCLVIAALAALGVFWRPGFTLWGLGSSILVGCSIIAGFIGIVIGGRVNLYAVELGRHLRDNADEEKSSPRSIRQTGPMTSREAWVAFVDPVWAGGLGYPIANLFASGLGLSFGFIPAIQALLSNVTGLRRCQLLYKHHEQPSLKWHRYAAWATLLLLLLSGTGLVLALLNVSVLGIDRGALLFYALVPLNTGQQALFGPWRWMRKRSRKLDGLFWKQFLAGMLPILGGILSSAVCGIAVAELIGHAFTSVYPEATYGHLLMYHYVKNFLSILGQETTQVIIGGIGVQLLLSGLRPVFWQVWAGLLARASELFKDWFIGLVTLRWLRSKIRVPRRRSNQPSQERVRRRRR